MGFLERKQPFTVADLLFIFVLHDVNLWFILVSNYGQLDNQKVYPMKKMVNREKKAGRPKGSKTRLVGLTAFMAKSGYKSKSYVHEVLTGKRLGGRPVRQAWAKWMAAQSAAK